MKGINTKTQKNRNLAIAFMSSIICAPHDHPPLGKTHGHKPCGTWALTAKTEEGDRSFISPIPSAGTRGAVHSATSQEKDSQ